MIEKIGAPEEIRTPDPQIRSLVLYPAELRARTGHRGPKGRFCTGHDVWCYLATTRTKSKPLSGKTFFGGPGLQADGRQLLAATGRGAR